MAGIRRPSDPDADTCELATRIYEAGRRRCCIPEQGCAFPETQFKDPTELADAIISYGCRELQAEDIRAHGNRLPKGSLGSQAQSIMERLHHQPEPRAAQLVRHRVRADWMMSDERLNELADRVVTIGLADEEAPDQDDPEAVALWALGVARRRLSAAEGNHIQAGGAAAELDAAYDTFYPRIRRHALADIVLSRLQRASNERKAGAHQAHPKGALQAEA